MSKIWIVEGNSGEYSDRRDWPVQAFVSEARAQRLVLEAQARANEIMQFCNSDFDSFWECSESEPKDKRVINEFDPNMYFDSIVLRYYCYQIELDESIL